MATSCLAELPVEQTAVRGQPGRRCPAIGVLHVINGQHYAGAERVQDLLASRLGELGFEVGFACLKPGQFPHTRRCQAAPLYRLSMRHRLDLRPVRQLVKIIRRHGYQLLHAHTARSALIAAVASKITGVPLVHHVHSPTARDSTRLWRARLNAIIERISLRRASALITVSNSLRLHVLERGIRGETVSVVPNGVPHRRPRPPRRRSKTEWTLGTVALFRPRKGVEVLLRAMAVLRAEGLAVRLRAVGGFETQQYERRIKRLAQQLGLAEAVDWTGFRHDVDGELAEMDLFVLPSLFGEGLPMVVLEAMAAGVPVVATRVEGVPEAIRDGRDGAIAEPDDAQDLAAAVRRIIGGRLDWHALRASALKRHAEKFSERSMAAGVADVYRRVLHAR